MDWDCELQNDKLENMLTVYQDHIDVLEAEIKQFQEEILFLKQQLEYKTMGLPCDHTQDTSQTDH
tara:strand:- start:203 stop:397 length:195 start_codon:yes stop_codon:yes gene_type:complete